MTIVNLVPNFWLKPGRNSWNTPMDTPLLFQVCELKMISSNDLSSMQD
jgi:hypothetical protein